MLISSGRPVTAPLPCCGMPHSGWIRGKRKNIAAANGRAMSKRRSMSRQRANCTRARPSCSKRTSPCTLMASANSK